MTEQLPPHTHTHTHTHTEMTSLVDYQISEEEIKSISHELFQQTEEEETFSKMF